MTKTLKFLSEVNLMRSCISRGGAKMGFPHVRYSFATQFGPK